MTVDDETVSLRVCPDPSDSNCRIAGVRIEDESLILKLRNHKWIVKHLFRFSLYISLAVHVAGFSAYLISMYTPASDDVVSGQGLDLPKTEIEMDIPPELIGGTSSPAPVDKQEWVEGKSKTGADPEEKEVNTNQISGDGTDKDGYLFSFNGDKPPSAIIDFDLRSYFPAEAKAASITTFTVQMLIQVDERGSLVSANVVSGKAPYGFNDAAQKIIHRARFSPGYKSGKPVKMAHYLPINFVLEQ
jgi:protein TonB